MGFKLKRFPAAGWLFLAMALTAGGVAGADAQWELSAQKSDVSLYFKDVPDSEFDMFKGTTVVDASMTVIAAVLRDVPASGEWMANIVSGRVLRKFDANHMIVHSVIDFPWPFGDRDMILESETTFQSDTGEVLITSRAISEPLVPRDEKRVRIDTMLQQFVLEFVEKEKTRVSYIIYLDPEGRLPAGLVNLSLQDVPYSSLQNLKKMVLRDKYHEADILDDGNFEITRALLEFHLKKDVREKKVVDKILADKEMIRFAVETENTAAGTRRVVAKLLETHLDDEVFVRSLIGDDKLAAEVARNREMIPRIANDGILVDALIDGRDRYASRIGEIMAQSGKTSGS